jgi:transcriptional regulator with XRE-family HTH domain
VKSVFTQEYEAVLSGLVAARKEAGITQQELARRIGKPQSFVSKYERRERRLDVVELVRIARALGFDPCRVIRDIEAHLASRSAQGKEG